MNSAESSCGSVSDSRRPLVKGGGLWLLLWLEGHMPNEILIPLQSLIFCFLESLREQAGGSGCN